MHPAGAGAVRPCSPPHRTYRHSRRCAPQAWALYVLVLFYSALHAELRPLNPLRKFVTIKLVVFASFWQGLTISILVAVGVLRAPRSMSAYEGDAFAGGLQDFLICIEVRCARRVDLLGGRKIIAASPPGQWQSERRGRTREPCCGCGKFPTLLRPRHWFADVCGCHRLRILVPAARLHDGRAAGLLAELLGAFRPHRRRRRRAKYVSSFAPPFASFSGLTRSFIERGCIL